MPPTHFASVQKFRKTGWIAAVILLGSTLVWAQDPGAATPEKTIQLASNSISAERLAQYADLAVAWERQYLQVNTSNPPGNEARAAAFFKTILDREGIENKVFEYAPGRANIWACVPRTANGQALSSSCEQDVRQAAADRKPIILLSHEDVVTSDPARWRVPPFSAQIVDGAMYGRGAQDMKSEGLAELVVTVMLKREHVALDRDVILLATADEEVGDTGSEWMIANQRELLNAQYLLTEGGENLNENGKAKFIGIDVAEKAPFWLTITATGRPGHGSRPIADSAPNRLVQALSKVVAYQTPLTVIPVVDEFFKAMAVYEPPARARYFRDINAGLKDASFRSSLEQDPATNYLLRNTISLTMLKGSEQTNVIPGVATANVDVRLLPGQDPKQFLEEICKVAATPNVTVASQPGEFRLANASPMDTPLFAAIKKVNAQYHAGAPVVPHLTSGYTENQMYRALGITCYGFSPYTATAEEGSTEHGDNERIRVEELRQGFRVLYDVVTQVAAAATPGH